MIQHVLPESAIHMHCSNATEGSSAVARLKVQQVQQFRTAICTLNASATWDGGYNSSVITGVNRTVTVSTPLALNYCTALPEISTLYVRCRGLLTTILTAICL
jgi:hypothetical protein